MLRTAVTNAGNSTFIRDNLEIVQVMGMTWLS